MNEVGRYRIQSVAEMTGVSAATLRAWERRYGIPAPQRTASAYRLYTDRDVELIRRVRELCAEGVAPAQAAQMVRAARSSGEGTASIELDTADLAVQRILEGVERFDVDMIEAAVRHAMLVGPAATLFDRVFGPVLAEVGDRWCTGAMTIAQEHLTSEIVATVLRDVLRILRPPGQVRTALLACFPDEEHVMPLLGVALALCDWKIRPIVLGARTPPSVIRHAVTELRPALVGLSMIVPVGPGHAARLLAEYASACGGTPWLVGGQAAHTHRGTIEAHGGIVAPQDRGQLRGVIDRLTMRRTGEMHARVDAAP